MNADVTQICQRRYSGRSGIASLAALLAILVTVSVCFLVLRTQTTSRLVQQNSRNRQRAREAASTGLHAALGRLHGSGWAGVGSTETMILDGQTRYEVDYINGDATLSPTDANWPLRVTIKSRGFYAQTQGPEVQANATAVVQLVPRAVAAEPANWSELTGKSLLHWGTDSMEFGLPTHVGGPVRSYGPIDLAPVTPPDSNRPFKGKIDEVAIWTGTLPTPAQMAQLHADCIAGQLVSAYGALFPDSWWRLNESPPATLANNDAYGADGEYQGPVQAQTGCPGETGNLAPQFDGHNDQVRIGDAGGSQFVVAAWVNEDGPGDAGASCIVGRGAGPGAEQSWTLSIVDNGGQRVLQLEVNLSGTLQTLVDTTPLLTNTWYFVAGSYDGSQMRLFVNGSQVAASSQTGNIANPINSILSIGDLPPGSAKATYLVGLGDIQLGMGSGDQDKPFTAAVETPMSLLSDLNRDLLENVLEVGLTDLTSRPRPRSRFQHCRPLTNSIQAARATRSTAWGPTRRPPRMVPQHRIRSGFLWQVAMSNLARTCSSPAH